MGGAVAGPIIHWHVKVLSVINRLVEIGIKNAPATYVTVQIDHKGTAKSWEVKTKLIDMNSVYDPNGGRLRGVLKKIKEEWANAVNLGDSFKDDSIPLSPPNKNGDISTQTPVNSPTSVIGSMFGLKTANSTDPANLKTINPSGILSPKDWSVSVVSSAAKTIMINTGIKNHVVKLNSDWWPSQFDLNNIASQYPWAIVLTTDALKIKIELAVVNEKKKHNDILTALKSYEEQIKKSEEEYKEYKTQVYKNIGAWKADKKPEVVKAKFALQKLKSFLEVKKIHLMGTAGTSIDSVIAQLANEFEHPMSEVKKANENLKGIVEAFLKHDPIAAAAFAKTSSAFGAPAVSSPKKTADKQKNNSHALKQIENINAADTPTTEFHPYHMVWAILNGQGNKKTERSSGGDVDATHGAKSFALPIRGGFPGLKITPYRGGLNQNWGPLGTGEAEILLRFIYAAQRELTPFTFRQEMHKLQEWVWWNMREIKRIMMFMHKFRQEVKILGRIPVFIGRDTYSVGFLYHVMGEPSFYLEGISRTVLGKVGHHSASYSPEYVKSMTMNIPLQKLIYVDTGFRGTIPKHILRHVYGLTTEAPSDNVDEKKYGMLKFNHSKYMAAAFYLMSSDAGKYVKTFAPYHGKSMTERNKFMIDTYKMSGAKYRDHILNLEYMPKLYLRPVEVLDGRPKMVPSGDAIKAALLNVAVLGFAQELFPDRDFNVFSDYPSIGDSTTKPVDGVTAAMSLMEKKDLKNFIGNLEQQIQALENTKKPGEPVLASKGTKLPEPSITF